ncbi:MAG: hypothetical protein R3C02_05315 [Planctomycetaceae bacterium]
MRVPKLEFGNQVFASSTGRPDLTPPGRTGCLNLFDPICNQFVRNVLTTVAGDQGTKEIFIEMLIEVGDRSVGPQPEKARFVEAAELWESFIR